MIVYELTFSDSDGGDGSLGLFSTIELADSAAKKWAEEYGYVYKQDKGRWENIHGDELYVLPRTLDVFPTE